MKEKKRAPAKTKKPAPKRSPKPSAEETDEDQLETQGQEEDQEMEMDGQEQMLSEESRGNRAPERPARRQEEQDDDRQPDFHEERRPNGVRPQDVRLSDEYTIETHFDRNSRLFVASVIEYPELRCTGHTRDEAQVDLEERLEDHVYDLKARGGQPAEPMQSRTFPEKLELPVSQTLYRKLDQLSRMEKMPIDKLVTELLTAVVERRGQSRASQPQNHQREHHHRDHHQGDRHHGQNRHHGGGGHGHRHQHQGGGNRQQRGGGGGGNYRALDSRENFMEYVRNLEKGGGPGWKKR